MLNYFEQPYTTNVEQSDGVLDLPRIPDDFIFEDDQLSVEYFQLSRDFPEDEADQFQETVFYIDEMQPVIDMSCLPSRCFKGLGKNCGDRSFCQKTSSRSRAVKQEVTSTGMGYRDKTESLARVYKPLDEAISHFQAGHRCAEARSQAESASSKGFAQHGSAQVSSQHVSPHQNQYPAPAPPTPLKVIDYTIDMLTDSPLPAESADHSEQRSAAPVHHLHPNSVLAPTPAPQGRPQPFRPHFTPLPMQQLARPASPFQHLLTTFTSSSAAAAHSSPAQHSPPQFVAAQHSHAQHSPAQHSPAQHSPAQHSPAQHSPAKHSPAKHSPAQHSPAQHSPAQHSPAQHSSAEVSTDMRTSGSSHHRAKKQKTGKDHLVTCLDAFDSIIHAGTVHQPAVLAKHADSAAQQEGRATELLHGDSILSSETHMHMDIPPLNDTPTGQGSDMSRFFTPPLAHAASLSPKGSDLKKKYAAETGQTSAAAGHAPMTNTGGTQRRTLPVIGWDAALKKSGSLTDGAYVKKRSAQAGVGGVANAAGRGSRKRKSDGSQVDGDALPFDFDAVLSGMPDDMGMDIDGSSFAELTAGFTAPCLNVTFSGSPSGTPSGDHAQQLQPAAAPLNPPAAPLNPPAATSQQQQRAAASIPRHQRRFERDATGSGAAFGSTARPATQAALSSVDGAAVGGGLARHKSAVRGEARNASRTAAPTSSGHRSRVSPLSTSPTPKARMHGQAATRYPTQVQGQKPGATREYHEGQMVWAQPKGYTFWPAMVQNPTDAQKQQTGWKAGKVFVVYFGTMEMESVSLKKVQPWDAMQAPSAATGSLGKAVAQALDSMIAEAAS